MQAVRAFLLSEIEVRPRGIVRSASERFGITRQAVHRHLNHLLRQGLIQAEGRTRARRYRIAVLSELEESNLARATTEAETLWTRRFAPLLEDVPAGVASIARFGFAEALSNALDHSGSTDVRVRLRRTGAAVEIRVVDQGVGIFRRLEELGLGPTRRGALAITQGGLSLVARAFDSFHVASGSHLLLREIRPGLATWRLEPIAGLVRGTTVGMRIATRSGRRLEEVLDGAVEIPVSLALDADELPTSRAHARRLLERVGSFPEVVLDLAGVAAIGPSWADEILSRMTREHPRLRFSWRNAAPGVERLLVRAAE